jgi:hypothetical protein
VVAADRRESEGLVLFGVLLAADPEEPEIEQVKGRRQRPLLGHALQRQVGGRVLAGIRQPGGELQNPVVLRAVPLDPPLIVVAVLPPAGCIRADGLDVAVGVRADPDVGPGGRDDEVADALEDLRILDRLPVLVEVGKAAAPAHACESGAGAVHSTKPGHGRLVPSPAGRPTTAPPREGRQRWRSQPNKPAKRWVMARTSGLRSR